MSQFFLWTFLVISLLIRLPVRIISRYSDKDIWGVIDLVGMVASIICIIGGGICAMANGEIEPWLFTAVTVLFGGIGLLITGLLIWKYFDDKKYNKPKQKSVSKTQSSVFSTSPTTKPIQSPKHFVSHQPGIDIPVALMSDDNTEDKQEKKEYTFTISAGELDALCKEVYESKPFGYAIPYDYRVPGFRNGKAPLQVLRKLYGSDVFIQDAIKLYVSRKLIEMGITNSSNADYKILQKDVNQSVKIRITT